ncbi:DUF6290 family protein [Promicromonospora sukumoe]|uniref:type II toxin-antitoxin system RelB family antitoxin n=1 Tax=Promicromonospora sukumoe TaxID=88382 RepID=UPI0037C8EC32
MTVTFRLSADEEARLNALSERTGRSKSFYVRTALREYLEDLEDAYIGDEAHREFEKSGRKSRPWAEAKAELFSDDSAPGPDSLGDVIDALSGNPSHIAHQ